MSIVGRFYLDIDISQSRLLPAGSLVGSFPFVATQLRKIVSSRMHVMPTAIFAAMMWYHVAVAGHEQDSLRLDDLK